MDGIEDVLVHVFMASSDEYFALDVKFVLLSFLLLDNLLLLLASVHVAILHAVAAIHATHPGLVILFGLLLNPF